MSFIEEIQAKNIKMGNIMKTIKNIHPPARRRTARRRTVAGVIFFF